MELKFFKRSKSGYTPASYSTNETTKLWNVAAGDLIGPLFARTNTVFNGSGTDAIIIVGDTGDTDRILKDGDMDEITTGNYMALGGAGSNYTAIGRHLYTAAGTIDVVFTANTAGTRTTGNVDFWCFIAKAFS